MTLPAAILAEPTMYGLLSRVVCRIGSWTRRIAASKWGSAIRPLIATLMLIVPLWTQVRDVGGSEPKPAASSRPNVVLILTDNHGAWTLGCYGNRDIATPHIDRLAHEGTLFSRAFANNPVCSPTRASLLTGLMPSQHGVHCFLFGGRLQMGPQARNTLAEFTSLPEILRRHGYACGLVGKWHLGDNLRPQEGLDDYWVTMPHGATSTFYGAQIIENGKLRREPTYLTEFWTQHAVRFIQQQASRKKPFFLFLSYNGPYALGRLLLKPGQNRHAARYEQADLPSFPREPAHPWQFNNLDYLNNPTSIRRVATEVSGIDDGVGTVMQALEDNGIAKNTLVIFLADQGWVGGHGGFFGMGDHTRPFTARDGMMHIPMIWWQPGKVASGRRVERLVSNIDVFPTLLDYLGLQAEQPDEPARPGRSFAAALRGQPLDSWTDEVFFEFQQLRCIRTSDWKLVRRQPAGPDELYHLSEDPQEAVNLFENEDAKAVRDRLEQRLADFFSQYSVPRFDLWHGGGSQTRLLADHTPPPPPASNSPSPTQPGFQPPELEMPAGFRVELVAAPPLIRHPTMAAFDDQGRLFVCENAGVNLSAEELEAELPNSIRLLTDTDGDGRFDRATTFADKMTFPMGAVWHRGALYVASPPYIWRLRDTDDDGVADERKILVREFGYTGNAASIHGCFLGPDGRLYWTDGYHGHQFHDESGGKAIKREGSYLFSCLPDGSDVRIHCGGGMDNPVEIDFTPGGEMLGTVNILYTRPRVDCLVHWLYGGTYPHRERVLAERKTTGDFLGPAHRFGHVAVSGMTAYRSGILDRHWRNQLFVTFFNSGKIVRVAPIRDGSTYRAEQFEFLSSSSREFHPTDVLEDADGSLLVVDTGGWFYRGCPTSQFAKPDIEGGIYRIWRPGAPQQIDPRGRAIDWANLSVIEAVSLLGDTRYAVREQAIDKCATFGVPATEALGQAVARRDPWYRLGATWALCRIANDHRSDAATVDRIVQQLRPALDDRWLEVRLAAIHTLALHPRPAYRNDLLRLLRDDEPSVRRRAAVALGRLSDASTVPALLKALPHVADRAEQHAILYALIEINDAQRVAQGLIADSPAIRLGALIVLDQLGTSSAKSFLTARQLLTLLRDPEVAVSQYALRVLRRTPDALPQAFPLVQSWWEKGGIPASQAELMSELLSAILASPAGRSSPEVIQWVARRLLDSGVSKERRLWLLESLGRRSAIGVPEPWIEPLNKLTQSADLEVAEAAVRAYGPPKDKKVWVMMTVLAMDETRPISLRLSAVESLAGSSARLEDIIYAQLLHWLDDAAASGVRGRIVQVISRASLTDRQLGQLLPYLEHAGPTELPDLLQPFQRTRNQEIAAALLKTLAEARSFDSLPPHVLSDVVKRYSRDLLPKANALLDRLQKNQDAKVQLIEQYLARMDEGDARRGSKVFTSEKAKCATCHRIGQEGAQIGPDLTTIGANRSARDLLESILFPSATIVRQYEPYVVRLEDGRVLNGLLARETQDQIVLQPQTGDPVTIDRDQIDAIQASTVSIMPAGLEKELSATELIDLVQYLLSCRAPDSQRLGPTP